MMRLALSLTALIASATAFAPCSLQPPRTAGSTVLCNQRVDTSEAVKAALEASAKYGATSTEAKLAWDAVEEMDASDNINKAAAFKAVPVSTKLDYLTHIRSLAFLVDLTKEQLAQMRTLAKDIEDLELKDPHLTDLGPGADGLREALAAAKAASDAHGPHSPEADAAWAALDECTANSDQECDIASDAVQNKSRYSAAALKAHHQYDAVLDKELLEQAINAFEVIENFGRFVALEKKRLD